MRWWLLVLFGCFLLGLTINASAALVIFVCVFIAFWLLQVKRINFLLAKIQGNIQKLETILRKRLPQNQKPN